MSDTVAVKLVVIQLDQEPEQHLYEQDMIKLGRGRVGKAKTGVDLQLVDPALARVHGVIQIKNLNDVFLMPMGTAATYINGKKVKSRGKLENGTVMELGTTQITVYLGEAAAHDYLANPLVNEQALDVSHADVEEIELAISTGEYEIVSGEHNVADLGSAPATDPGHSSAGWADAFADPTAGVASEPGESTDPGGPAPSMAPAAPMASVAGFSTSTEGFGLYPMHSEPEGTYGPMGPTPPPIPDNFPGANLEMLLEVHDRLGKESWYVQDIIW